MEETVSLKGIFDVLKKRMLLILSFIIGAVVVSGVISYFILTPTYEYSSQFIVSQQSPANQQVYDVNQIRSNVEIINTYNVVIKSSAILEEVIQEMELSISSEQLSSKLEVSNAQDSQVVTVTAIDTDPELAAAIANTTVRVFQEKIPDLMNINNVNILSAAKVPADPQPINPKPVLNIAVAMILGAMLGIGVAFLLKYLDTTIKTEADVEDQLEIPVLGIISHVKEEETESESFQKPLPSRARGGEYKDVEKAKKTI